jgi:hypothetical protein
VTRENTKGFYLRFSNYVLLGANVFHDMARPRFAEGGDGLQIRNVAVNVLNKGKGTSKVVPVL